MWGISHMRQSCIHYWREHLEQSANERWKNTKETGGLGNFRTIHVRSEISIAWNFNYNCKLLHGHSKSRAKGVAPRDVHEAAWHTASHLYCIKREHQCELTCMCTMQKNEIVAWSHLSYLVSTSKSLALGVAVFRLVWMLEWDRAEDSKMLIDAESCTQTHGWSGKYIGAYTVLHTGVERTIWAKWKGKRKKTQRQQSWRNTGGVGWTYKDNNTKNSFCSGKRS